MLLADEAMPDPDRERIRGQALPRIAISASVSGRFMARSEEMPDPSGAVPSRQRSPGNIAPAGPHAAHTRVRRRTSATTSSRERTPSFAKIAFR